MSCPAAPSETAPWPCDNIDNVLQFEEQRTALIKQIGMWTAFQGAAYGHHLSTPV